MDPIEPSEKNFAEPLVPLDLKPENLNIIPLERGKDIAPLVKPTGLSSAFNHVSQGGTANTAPKLTLIINHDYNGTQSNSKTSFAAIDEVADQNSDQSPTWFENLITGLKGTIKSAFDILTEGMRRQQAYDEAKKVIDHAVFLRPSDPQVWVLKAKIAREADAIIGQNFYGLFVFDDMNPSLRRAVTKMREDLAHERITGPLLKDAQAIIDGDEPYDYPDEFTFTEEHLERGLEIFKKINTALGVPLDNPEPWFQRLLAAETLSSLMGESIPHDILAEMDQDFAKELDAIVRYIAYKEMTDGTLDEMLNLTHQGKLALIEDIASPHRKFG